MATVLIWTLDVPVHDAACTRRQRTDTPLQALVLDERSAMLEASRRLAERVIHQSPEDGTRLNYLGEVLARSPWEARENRSLKRVDEVSDAMHKTIRGRRILKVGESNRDNGSVGRTGFVDAGSQRGDESRCVVNKCVLDK